MKKANFADKHLEKIVLAVAVILAAVGVYFFIAAAPNQIEVSNRSLQPGDIPPLLAERAEALRNSIETRHDIPDFELPDYVRLVGSRESDRPTRLAGFDVIGEPLPNEFTGNIDNLEQYGLPSPPLAMNPNARQGTAVLRLTGQNAVDEPIKRLINAEAEPFDFRYVTVGATFDLAEWRSRIEQADNPIPDNWWRETLDAITGVYLERQELLDPSTREWSEPVRIKPLSEFDALEPDLSVARLSNPQIEAMQASIRNQQDLYRRPPFVSVQRDYMVHDPFSEARSDDTERELEDLFDDVESKTTQIDRLTEQLERGVPGERGAAIQNRLSTLLAERAEVRLEINDLVDLDLYGAETSEMPDFQFQEPELFDPSSRRPTTRSRTPGRGMMPEDFMMDEPPPPTPRRRQTARPTSRQAQLPTRGFMRPDTNRQREIEPEAVENPDEIRVAAHDLTVEPGKTYRYRVVVTVRNPLFRQTRVAPEQREANYDRLTLGPSESELQRTAERVGEDARSVWTEPITIEPELYYFLLRAQARAALVEVWRVYNGRWREAEFQNNPGDFIGGVAELNLEDETVALPMQADAIVVDVVSSNEGGLGGGDTQLIVASGDGQTMASRSTGSGRQTIERVRLRNQNRINDLLEEIGSIDEDDRFSRRP
jgi:hypothetical protein